MKGETQDLGGVVESSPVVEFCIIRLIGKASAGESLLGQLPARDGESLPDLGLDYQDLLLAPACPRLSSRTVRGLCCCWRCSGIGVGVRLYNGYFERSFLEMIQ